MMNVCKRKYLSSLASQILQSHRDWPYFWPWLLNFAVNFNFNKEIMKCSPIGANMIILASIECLKSRRNQKLWKQPRIRPTVLSSYLTCRWGQHCHNFQKKCVFAASVTILRFLFLSNCPLSKLSFTKCTPQLATQNSQHLSLQSQYNGRDRIPENNDDSQPIQMFAAQRLGPLRPNIAANSPNPRGLKVLVKNGWRDKEMFATSVCVHHEKFTIRTYEGDTSRIFPVNLEWMWNINLLEVKEQTLFSVTLRLGKEIISGSDTDCNKTWFTHAVSQQL